MEEEVKQEEDFEPPNLLDNSSQPEIVKVIDNNEGIEVQQNAA